VETNATRMCERLVGLPDVTVLAVDDRPGQPIGVHVEQRNRRPACDACGSVAVVKDRPVVVLVDLPCFGGRPGWCGASTAGPARRRRAQRGRGPAKTRASPHRGWR
jgi:hypothetical protein